MNRQGLQGHRRNAGLLCAALLVIISGLPGPAGAQDAEILITVDTPIPERAYKTWSLFLISNPDWILAAKNEEIGLLFDQFTMFGDVIGREHLAVWFWSRDPRSDQYYRAVDVLRARAFCRKLGLPPDEGPYVLVTSEYPGAGLVGEYPETFVDELAEYQVINLKDAGAEKTARLLTELAEKLRLAGVGDLDSDDEGFWRTLFETTREVLVGFAENVTVKVSARGVEAEYSP